MKLLFNFFDNDSNITIELNGNLFGMTHHFIPIFRLNQANEFQGEPCRNVIKYMRLRETRKIRLDHLKMKIGVSHGGFLLILGIILNLVAVAAVFNTHSHNHSGYIYETSTGK